RPPPARQSPLRRMPQVVERRGAAPRVPGQDGEGVRPRLILLPPPAKSRVERNLVVGGPRKNSDTAARIPHIRGLHQPHTRGRRQPRQHTTGSRLGQPVYQPVRYSPPRPPAPPPWRRPGRRRPRRLCTTPRHRAAQHPPPASRWPATGAAPRTARPPGADSLASRGGSQSLDRARPRLQLPTRVQLSGPGQRSLGRGLPLPRVRSEEHTSELQSRENLVCRLLLEKKKDK